MVKDWALKILYLESVSSTQVYLKRLILDKKITSPYAVVSKIQTHGKGSRDNLWLGLDGNLFLSFSVPISSLPQDLKLESASIYFAYLLKMTLENENSKVWIKWPNDFYLEEKKIGGMITNVVKESIVCGVGLNLVTSHENFAKLDIEITSEDLLQKYFKNLERHFSWKQVFSKYKLEFYKSKNFSTHNNNNNEKISLGDASLQEDGSIISNNKRIYSLR